MRVPIAQSRRFASRAHDTGRRPIRAFTAALLLAIFPSAMIAQQVADPPLQPQATQPAAAASATKEPRNSDRRRAARLYTHASKLFMAERYEDAIKEYDEAAKLDPTNNNYRLAAGVARDHAVTALIQTAAKDRLRSDEAGARAALAHALQIDPRNVEATQHLYELGDDAVRGQSGSLYEQPSEQPGEPVTLSPAAGVHSFHIHSGQRVVVQQVFRAYGIDAMTDESIHDTPVRLDIDDATFQVAAHAVALITHSFYVPLDAHRVVVATDTPQNRQEFIRQELETVYLGGLKADEMTEVGKLATEVFNIQHATPDQSANTITIRAPRQTVDAFNATVRDLIDGHSQVMLDVRMLQIAHTSGRNLGVQLPQTITAFNVYSEEQAILNQNAALVQQIISSGLAAPGDTLAILGILLASGQVSGSSIFTNGIALFGGGLTLSGLSPGPAKAYFNLNSSDTREIDDIQLRLGDGEAGTLKEGERYPIQTSSYSSLSPTLPNIPGLSGAGNSGSLSSILASLQNSVPNIPQVQYQDLGLTLKTTPNVMRDGRVALTIDLQVSALSGSSIDGNPILNNRAYSGVVTIKEGSAVVVASQIDKTESNLISGTPGLSEIPGMNNVTDKNVQKNVATLLIIITPHVVRGTQSAGHTPMMRVEKSALSQ